MSFVSFDVLPSYAGTVNIPTARRPARPQGLEVYARQTLPTDPTGSATLIISGIPDGTDIVVLNAGTTNVILQVDQNPGTTYVFNYSVYSVDTAVDIGLIKPGYELHYIRNLTLPRINTTLPVALRLDRNFS